MKPDEAWDILGIAPTDDAGAIRSAYAARLKAIDPETDPQAFIALRAAFDAVRGVLAWTVELPAKRPETERFEPGPAPARFGALVKADAPAGELMSLLWSGMTAHEGKPWREGQATAAQTADMRDLWHAVITDPRMEQVAHYAGVEQWLSELIARTAPFSDPLVLRATLYFGWQRSPAGVDRTSAVTSIVRRHHLLDYITALKAPRHMLHPAWRELVTPVAEGDTRGEVDARLVHELLSIAATRYPGLNAYFVPERVALWTRRAVERQHSEADRQARQWFAVAAVFVGIVFFVGLSVMMRGAS